MCVFCHLSACPCLHRTGYGWMGVSQGRAAECSWPEGGRVPEAASEERGFATFLTPRLIFLYYNYACARHCKQSH